LTGIIIDFKVSGPVVVAFFHCRCYATYFGSSLPKFRDSFL